MTAGARPVRAPRGHRAHLQGLGTGGRHAHADEQPRPRGGGATRRSRRLRRHRARRRARGRRSTRIVATLRTLEDDETMLVQSGKPVGVFRTHEWAPRVLIANSNLVPEWATWEEFRRLEALGLTMYGQMTAGSWIYIGTQGILQGTYECFAEIARRRFGGTLRRHDHADRRARRHGRRAAARRHDERRRRAVRRGRRPPHRAPARDPLPRRGGRRARRRARSLRAPRRPQARALSVGLLGNAADVVPELLDRGFDADIVTDQTSAHDPLSYVPERPQPGGGRGAARRRPRRVRAPRSRQRWPPHCEAMVGFLDARRRGLRLRQQPARRGRARRLRPGLRLPGLRARVHPPAVLRGQGPVPLGRAVGRSGGHRGHRPRRARGVPRRRGPRAAGSSWPSERVAFQGLPARICWLGYGERAPRRAAVQRDGALRRGVGADRHRPRPPRLRLGRVARTARPRRWPTAATRSPTGRCSTRSSTPPRARPG